MPKVFSLNVIPPDVPSTRRLTSKINNQLPKQINQNNKLKNNPQK